MCLLKGFRAPSLIRKAIPQCGATITKTIFDLLVRKARNVSFRISLRWPIHIINTVDETKLSNIQFDLGVPQIVACISFRKFRYKYPDLDNHPKD